MRKRRKPVSIFRILVLLALIGVALYFNQTVVPTVGPIGVPSPTATRSPESFITEAENFFKDGKLLKAVDTYKAAIRTDPQNRDNYVKLAIIEALQTSNGDYKGALDNVNMALVGNDNYAYGHGVKGWLQVLSGTFLEADASIKKAMDLDPNNPLFLAYYAEYLITKGEYGDIEKAIKASRDAISLGKNLYETHRARGIVLYNTGNYEESLKEFENAQVINKNIPDLYLYIGYCYRSLGDYGRANEAFLQANALNPGDSIPDLEISRTYATVGEFAKAVQYAQKAVEEDSTNPHRHGNLGIMYYKNQQYSEAVDAFTIAIRGGTAKDGKSVQGLPLDRGRVVQYYFTYGLSLAHLNRCAEAVPVMQAILNGVPDDEIAVYNANEGLSICKQNLEGVTPSGTEITPDGQQNTLEPTGQPTKAKVNKPTVTPTPKNLKPKVEKTTPTATPKKNK
jgi:tetratricopeptide (TPR) repeat protein